MSTGAEHTDGKPGRGFHLRGAGDSWLHRLVHHLPDGLAYVGMDGRILDCNAALERLVRYDREELLGLGHCDLTPEKWHAVDERVFREELLSRGFSSLYEKEYRRKDGVLVPVELLTILDHTEGDTPTGMLAVVRDISGRKLAEAALQEARFLLDETQRLAGIGSCSIDLATGSWTSSSGLDLIFGIDKAYRRDLAGWLDIVHPEDRALMTDLLSAEALNKRGSFDKDYRITRVSDGKTRWVRGRGELRRDEAGAATHLIGTVQDITDYRRIEAEREEHAREAEQKNQELERFLYAVSHDLRMPLVNIQGFADLLKKYCAQLQKALPPELAAEGGPAGPLLSKDIPEATNYLISSAVKLEGLVSAMLKVARCGSQKPELARVDMNALIGGILSAMAFQLSGAGAQVSAGPLPDCLGDAGLLSQVFANLLDNAVKYRAPDRPLAVKISGRINDCGLAEYTVADNGPGLSKEEICGRVWALFYRGKARRTVAGEGVGLSTVRRIAELHGGKAYAANGENGGASFTVALKAAP